MLEAGDIDPGQHDVFAKIAHQGLADLKGQNRLFLLLAALLLLYSLGKMVHISSLLIIITFGIGIIKGIA